MRHARLRGVYLAVLAGCLLLPPPVAAGQEPIRIACVGDSITEGGANADYRRNSWPLILQRLLDARHPEVYQVGNFGRSGATMLRRGTRPYWDQDVHRAAQAFAPDVVVVNLGTNDATPRNWPQHAAEFGQDTRDLVQLYAALPSRPRVLLSSLTPQAAPYAHLEEARAYRSAASTIIQRVADAEKLTVIDFTRPFAGDARYIADGVHPNTAGNELLAQAAFTAITGEPAPRDVVIRPRSVEAAPHALVAGGKPLRVVQGRWTAGEGCVEGSGARNLLLAAYAVGSGDFHLRARLRMEDQKNSAACFFLGDDVFGFEGARGTLFRRGPHVGALRLLHPSPRIFERGRWIDFEVIRNGDIVWYRIDGHTVDMAQIVGRIDRLGFDPMRSTMQIAEWSLAGNLAERRPLHVDRRTVACPWIDLTSLLASESGPAKQAPSREAFRLLSPDRQVAVRFESAGNEPAAAWFRQGPADGASVSEPVELPVSLTGRGHVGSYLPNGELLLALQDTHPASPTRGKLVAWVGRYDDVVQQREGRFTAILVGDAGAIPDGVRIDDDGAIEVPYHLAGTDACHAVRFSVRELMRRVPTRDYELPLIDLAGDATRQVVVDREPGQYLGHPTTCLLEDGKTMLCVYPKGHGRGAVLYKRSLDGGRTWSDRLPTPESWATSREVPTLHRMVDPRTGKKRIIMWSGLYPARRAVSEDDGETWSELEPAGDWGGIVVMGFVESLENGSYIAMFHDDGRFFTTQNRRTDPPAFTLYQTLSHDGGLSWTRPEVVWQGRDLHLCEPGCVRSPDGSTLAVLLRENSRRRNSYVIFSRDEAQTWSPPRELPASLTGDRHTGRYAPDGRLVISFRDTSLESPTQGDWVAWVGTFDDLEQGLPGQYRVRLEDNKHRWDCAYPGVEVLPDGTFVLTTYGHWAEKEEPYILSTRLKVEELDARAAALPSGRLLFAPGMRRVHTFRIPALVTTNAGTLIACCDARVASARDLPNHIDTVIRRSMDGGETWGPIQTIVDSAAPEGVADPCLVVDRETGRVWLGVTWSRSTSWQTSKPGFGADTFRSLVLFSDDDGLTWSNPRDITRDLKDPTWRSIWFSPGSGLQLRSGRLFLPFSAADEETMYSYAAVSDDHGVTWRRVGPMGIDTNENTLAQLADGTLVCNMRSGHDLGQRAVSTSKNDGETWTGLAHVPGLVEPECQGSLLTLSEDVTTDGREWLVFANPASKRRERMAIKVSFDGGASWPVERVVHTGPAAYSCLTLLPSGHLGLLYERGREHPYESMAFARIPLSWLVPPAD